MRTTINIDPQLLDEVVSETGEKDKGRAVNTAMADYLEHRKVERLLAARGKFPDLVDRTAEWEEEEIELETQHKRKPLGNR